MKAYVGKSDEKNCFLCSKIAGEGHDETSATDRVDGADGGPEENRLDGPPVLNEARGRSQAMLGQARLG